MGDTRSLFARGATTEHPYVVYMAAVNYRYAVANSHAFMYMQLPCVQVVASDAPGVCAGCVHERHGPRHASWCKLLAVWHALDVLHSDLAVWMDSDAYFKATEIGVEHLFEQSAAPLAFFRNVPFNSVGKRNAGVFMVRNGSLARRLLAEWWDDNPSDGAFNLRHDYEQRSLSHSMAKRFGSSMHILRPAVLLGRDALVNHVATFRAAQRVPLARQALERDSAARLLTPADFAAVRAVPITATAPRARDRIIFPHGAAGPTALVYFRPAPAPPFGRAPDERAHALPAASHTSAPTTAASSATLRVSTGRPARPRDRRTE